MKQLSLARMGALALAISAMSGAYAADTKSVAVTAIVEHPALDAVRDGVKDALKAAGYEEGKSLKWQYQSAQGNTGTAAQIARKFVGDKPDAIVAIATPSAQAVIASTKTVPVVFSAVHTVHRQEVLFRPHSLPPASFSSPVKVRCSARRAGTQDGFRQNTIK